MIPSLTFSRRAAFAGALAAGLFASLPASLADEAKTPAPGVVSVTGEGVAAVAPDMAVLSLTVLREAKTAREALDANNKAMADVLGAMKEEGIAERDLQTGAFSIQPRWVYPEPKNGTQAEPKIVGYTATNSLTVRVRDLSRLGAILDTSVTLGVNQGGDVMFTNDDKDTVRDAARLDAIAKAKAKAEAMVGALGVKLGRITQIAENSYSAPPMPMARAEMVQMSAKAADAVPVASGENEYRVTVNVTWEIDQ
ncbi:SIMPL domain-containing protein [Hoeflea olei]|uniref:SIMPL domain-containing protein n=1 Tax=Hoeflea olei TaxID=1480615 RepID=A0A1C1YUL7_9HYPH|nr:SIMPL domain-containing protein [Hoeflea olei]OCW57232.1 hypothetical protein AWJ14_13025 [Hoeflea olei]